MKTRLPLFLTALAALACAAAPVARAQTVITSLPYIISTGGLYVLNSNLSSTQTSGGLITVAASNVTLDMQGHFISGPVGNTSQDTSGIYAVERANVTVKNGTVAYCQVGIDFEGNGSATTNAVDARITNMRVTYCYEQGISVFNVPATTITSCQISQIGYSAATFAAGINLGGSGITVQHCTVNNLLGGSSANTIAIYSETGCFAIQNQVSNAMYGVDAGVYQDNLAYSCTNAFTGGTDAGGNTSN